MKLKKSFIWVGLLVVVGAVGVCSRLIIVGIPPRDQSASVLLVTQKTATTATSDRMVTDTNKISTTSTTGTGPVGTVLNDLCSNIDGIQAIVPAGYATIGGSCLLLIQGALTTDQCSNIAGVQATVPVGYQVSGGVCTLIPVTAVVTPGFYLMAGHDSAQMYNDVWKMNTTTNAWTNITQNAPWTKREYSESVYFKGKIYLMGGIDASGYKNDIWSYNGSAWSQVDTNSSTPAIDNAPWSSRARFAAVVWNNKIWVMGGRINAAGARVNDVWSSVDGINWVQSTLHAGWAARDGFKAFVFNNNLYITGGAADGLSPYGGSSEIWKTVDGANWVSTSPWTYNWNGNYCQSPVGSTLFDPRTLHGAAVYNNAIWLIGGTGSHCPPGGSAYNDAWASTDGITWVKRTANIWPANTSGGGIFYGRREVTVAAFNNKIWVMAGSYDALSEQFFNDVWAYNGTTWAQVDAVPSTSATIDNAPWAARDGLTSVYVP